MNKTLILGIFTLLSGVSFLYAYPDPPPPGIQRMEAPSMEELKEAIENKEVVRGVNNFHFVSDNIVSFEETKEGLIEVTLLPEVSDKPALFSWDWFRGNRWIILCIIFALVFFLERKFKERKRV